MPKKLPSLEQYGLRYLKKLRKKHPPSRIDVKAHILDNEERAHINKIEKQAIINVTIAGIVSSIVSGVVAFFYDPLLDASSGFFSNENLHYWTIVMGATILATMVEVFYIYYDMMAKTHALTAAAHLELFESDDSNIASSLVRAAMELPNKKKADINIDPRKESSKMVIFMAAVLYKLKISATNFLLKALVKRMMGRAVSRAWLNFLAVPVCALWNGVVCWLVIREVKIRVLGPSAVNEILNQLKSSLPRLSHDIKLAILQSVGSCVVRTGNLHPNLEYLYRSLQSVIQLPKEKVLDDSKLFLQTLQQLETSEKQFVLIFLIYAAILDGKVTLRERKLLERAYAICERDFDYKHIKEAMSKLRAGKMIDFGITGSFFQ